PAGRGCMAIAPDTETDQDSAQYECRAGGDDPVSDRAVKWGRIGEGQARLPRGAIRPHSMREIGRNVPGSSRPGLRIGLTAAKAGLGHLAGEVPPVSH